VGDLRVGMARNEGSVEASRLRTLIGVEGVSKAYGQGKERVSALVDVSLEVEPGELFAIVGPSGCGKSTLLDLIAGFASPDEGRVLVHGEEVVGPDSGRVLIFQEHGLLPWRSALANVELGLEVQGVSRVDRRRKAREWLRLMGLEDFAHKKAHELSGGMRQRVNIARALAVDPEILLMDEPFGAVDALTRLRLQDELLSLRRKGEKTIVLVTHDIEEALYLGDRVAVMTERPGRLSTVIRVELSEPRNRTSTEFMRLRERVMEEFRLLPDRPAPEYLI